MKWGGAKPLVIGTVDDYGVPVLTYTILPGAEIPEEAIELIRTADELHQIPQSDPTNMEKVKGYFQR